MGGRGKHEQSEIKRLDVLRFNWFACNRPSAVMTLLISFKVSPDLCESRLPPCGPNEESHTVIDQGLPSKMMFQCSK